MLAVQVVDVAMLLLTLMLAASAGAVRLVPASTARVRVRKLFIVVSLLRVTPVCGEEPISVPHVAGVKLDPARGVRARPV